MKKLKLFFANVKNFLIAVFHRLGRWFKRAFFGTHKEMSLLEEEAIQSPLKSTVKKFFKNKLATISVITFVFVFCVCFIGTAFTQNKEIITDTTQINTAPGYSLLAMPSDLKKNGVKDMAIGSTYSMGIDNNGKMYVWGNNLSDLKEGYYVPGYKVVTSSSGRRQEVDIYMRVNAITGEFEDANVYDQSTGKIKNGILTAKEAIKLMNNANLKAEKVWGGYDSFFFLLEDGTLRGFGLNNESMSYGNAIISDETIIKEIKEKGILSMSLTSQKSIVITNDSPEIDAPHTFYGWGGNIGNTSFTLINNAINRTASAKKLSPTKAYWTQENLFVLYSDNLFYTIHGSSSSALATGSPLNAISTAQSNIFSYKKTLLGDFYDTLSVEFSIEKEFAKLTDEEITDLYDNEQFKERVFELAADSPSHENTILSYKSNEATIVRETERYNTMFNGGIRDIYTTTGSILILNNNNEIYGWGDNASKELNIPELDNRFSYISLEGIGYSDTGKAHVTALYSDFLGGANRLKVWGYTEAGIDSFDKDLASGDAMVSKVYSSFYQSYAVDSEGNLLDKWGRSGYLFGTDEFGRDVFTRLMHGGRISLTIGLIAVLIEFILGIIIGGIAGFYGGRVDTLLMRLCEVVGSIPFLPLAMTLSMICTKLGVTSTTGRMVMIMLILGLLGWPGIATTIRAYILSEREKEFVTAAKALGVKTNKIIFRHIVPNVMTIIIINLTAAYAGSLLTEASLSFLGFGVQLPTPSWGNMLTGAQSMNVIRNFWWRWIFPGATLSLTTICINLIGDYIRDAVDPRSSER